MTPEMSAVAARLQSLALAPLPAEKLATLLISSRDEGELRSGLLCAGWQAGLQKALAPYFRGLLKEKRKLLESVEARFADVRVSRDLLAAYIIGGGMLARVADEPELNSEAFVERIECVMFELLSSEMYEVYREASASAQSPVSAAIH